jgi:hypothetical protein
MAIIPLELFMSVMSAIVAFEDTYSREFRKSLDPHVHGLLMEAFTRAYYMGERDAWRWRYATDEAVQDRLERPVGLAVAIIDDKLNGASHYDVKGWAVAWDVNANIMVDEMMASDDGWQQRKLEWNIK